MASLELIKKLREETGCGIADCNKALKETNDSFEESIDWLRKKGLSKAAKKSGRVTAEGLVSIINEGNRAVVLEINSETDFVARNDKFQKLVKDLTTVALECNGDIEKMQEAKYPGTNNIVKDELAEQIGVIGENINIRRAAYLEATPGIITSYIHNAIVPNLGKIGVLLAINSVADKAKLEEFGKNVAMHIAATKPEFLNIENVSAEKIEKEKGIAAELARNSGKPENIIEKMVEGRVRKYYEEVVLLEQPFVMDDKKKIKDVVAEFEKEVGTKVVLENFVMFILGEGIEKEVCDFAAEVASMSKQ